MPETGPKVGIRDEIRVFLKLFPVFRRYTKDREKVKRAKDHQWDPKIEENGRKALNAFISLGPTFIKLGQIISARPDLLPNEYIRSFEQLQDNVPAAPFKAVKPTIEGRLGKIEEVFDQFNREAISGASLGQVYLAKYRGKDVVLKVNRPNVRETLKRDLAVIQRLLRLAKGRIENFLYISIENVVNDFSGRIFDEADYVKEAANIEKIAEHLSHRSERVIVPEVLHELSSEQILVMSYSPGTKITDSAMLKEMGVDLKDLAWRLDLLFMRMLLKDDIFHADPHPGNISVLDDGTIVLYDFGMVGSLDKKTRFLLLKLYDGLASTDPDVIIDSLLAMNALSPAANRGVMRRTIELAISNLQGKPIQEREIQELFQVANDVIFEFPFRLPRELVLYMRMSSLLEGICKQLDPDFKFISILQEILYQEGMLNELYSFEISEFLRKSIASIEKGLDVLPLLKRRLEDDLVENKRTDSRIPASIFLGFFLLGSFYLLTKSFILGSALTIIDVILFVLLFITKK